MGVRRLLVALTGSAVELPAADQVRNFARSTQRAVPVLAGSVTVDPASEILILEPALNLGSLTLVLPTAPVEGERHEFVCRTTITTLTITAGAGKTLIGAPTTIGPAVPFALVYCATSTTWFRVG